MSSPRGGTSAIRRSFRRTALVLATLLVTVTGVLVTATAADAATAPRLMVSFKAGRSSPTALDSTTVSRPAFVFVQPGRATISSVVFTLDPGTRTEVRVTRSSPFNFGSTAANGSLLPLQVSGLAIGTHRMSVAVTFANGRQRQLVARFTVARSATTGPTTTTNPPAATTTPPPPATSTTITPPPTTTPPTTTPPPTTPPPTTPPPTTPPPTTPPPTTTASTPTQAGTCTNPAFTTSGNDVMRQFNGYFVHNNLWNPPAGGSQTLSACSEKSWFVEAKNFPNNNFEVFSYPNVHQDLPNWPNGVAVSSLSTIESTFAGVPQAKGNYNVAYDIWLNGVGNGNGSTELMIWTETRPQTLEPLGTDQGDLTVNGVVYDVYHYTSGGLNVVSYKARSTVRSGTFDLKQIIGDGVSRRFIPANPRLSAVDYGIEYRFTDGTARFDVTDFSVTTQPARPAP